MKAQLSRRAEFGLRRRHFTDRIVHIVMYLLAFTVAAVIFALLGYVVYQGAGAISWHFLTAPPSEHEAGGGIGPLIFNSFYILLLTLFFTVPIAVGAAIYLEEYAPPGPLPRAVRFGCEVLATIPSIVMGLFGLLVFVYFLRWRFSAIGGALTLTLLNLPAMMRTATIALNSVPRASREGSMALGATCWYTIRHVVLPAASASLISGIVLVTGRIFGETAALIYTAGVSIEPAAPYNLQPFHPAETLSVHLWYTHAESLVPDVQRVGDGSALVLTIMVMLFNFAARGIGVALNRNTGTR